MDIQQNKQLVMQGYQLFQAGDIAGLLQLFADDAEWVGPTTEYVTFSGNRHGTQELAQFFAELDRTQEARHFAPEDMIAEGDKVVVTGQATWTVRATGQDYDNPWVHIFTIRDGKVAKFQQFNDTAAARKAFKPVDTAAQQAGTGTGATPLH
ncbi:nuclear transport factor 2 family protein [Noviherbaspirillum cavernae]|nr:nuclear transport factor 2 family protein [Noviherbaspirillum cavernae]